MYHNGWLKYMSQIYSMCCYYPLNTQAIFYNGHYIHFDARALNILQSHHIQPFILKVGDSVKLQLKNDGPNLNPKNLYGNSIMKCKRKHGDLNFTLDHMNDTLV